MKLNLYNIPLINLKYTKKIKLIFSSDMLFLFKYVNWIYHRKGFTCYITYRKFNKELIDIKHLFLCPSLFGQMLSVLYKQITSARLIRVSYPTTSNSFLIALHQFVSLSLNSHNYNA